MSKNENVTYKLYRHNYPSLYFQESQTGEEGGHSSEDSGHCSPEPESEFLKVHAQLTLKAGKFLW